MPRLPPGARQIGARGGQGRTVSVPTMPSAACLPIGHQSTYAPGGSARTVNTAEGDVGIPGNRLTDLLQAAGLHPSLDTPEESAFAPPSDGAVSRSVVDIVDT